MDIDNNYRNNFDFGSPVRQRIIRVFLILFAVVYIARLGYLQIIKGGIYRIESETQAIKQEPVEPFRGDMYDRNGELIVHNEASFSVTLTPYNFKKESLPLLFSILDLDTAYIMSIIDNNHKDLKFTPMKIYRDLEFDKLAKIEENYDYLPGIDIIVESKRLYSLNGNMAHLLGYTREATREQIDKRKKYKPGDVIGQSGIELNYDEMLGGTKGIKYIAVNNFGKRVASFDNGKSDIQAKNGFDIFLSIDKKLQEYAEQLLGDTHKPGAVVAIDPNNGEILAMVSKPDYNIREFSGKIPHALYDKLNNDPSVPLLNRAIMSAYPPGSTWKMLMATAGLQEGLIDENTTIDCNGEFSYGGRVYKCHGAHGKVNVKKAIQASCNVFFYKLALKAGMDNLEKYGKMYGFGEKTYIDIPYEKTGVLPTRDWIIKHYGSSALNSGNLVNYGIGQGEILVTPLQLANYAATLANKGTYYQPHIVQKVHNNITDEIQPMSYDKRVLPVNRKVFDIIQKGMYDVVNTPGGTATRHNGLRENRNGTESTRTRSFLVYMFCTDGKSKNCYCRDS